MWTLTMLYIHDNKKMKRKLVILTAIAAATVFSSLAQSQNSGRTERHNLAQAAAYKALYTCSGIFDADLNAERLQADIFDGAGSSTRDAMAHMTPHIDFEKRLVSVSYVDNMPPRIAAWRPHLGCAQLPIGAGFEAVAQLPRLPTHLERPDFDNEDWPQGDRNAEADLPSSQHAKLSSVFDSAFSDAYGGVMWGLVAVKDGKIVMERYSRGYDMHTPQRTNSMAKSLAATLVGAAVHQGVLDIYAPAPIPEWQGTGDPRGAITINNLLNMASGLYTEGNGNPQSLLYFGGAAATERSAVNILDSMPGERWVYAGSDTILSLYALRSVLQDEEEYLRFPFEEVMWKIGMTRTTPETDWDGNFMMSGQLWSTARDFARFGLLYLNDGVWNGERILPVGWNEYVSTPAPAQPPVGRYSDGNGYGAQFWLYSEELGHSVNFYTARGARGQLAMIFPGENVVIVRRGFDASGSSSFRAAEFAVDAIAALTAE
jgi:CubicO group peptidase (beta-lactamase class C family)